MIEEKKQPERHVNRWVLEPLFAAPSIVSLLFLVTVSYLVIGVTSHGGTDLVCLTLLVLVVAITLVCLAFAVTRHRR